ncbi:MAG: EpsG family protein [Lachnoclostridium sp.]
MIIYNSMIVWICAVMFLWVSTRARMVEHLDGTKRVPLSIAVLTFGYFIFWAGMRSGVADTAAYISMYNSFGDSFGDLAEAFLNAKAPGFELFSVIIKMIFGSNYHCWLMIIAIISGVSVMLTLWKHSEHFFSALTCLLRCWIFSGCLMV